MANLLIRGIVAVGMLAASLRLSAQQVPGSLVANPIPPSDDPRAELLGIVVARFGPDGRVYVADRVHQDIRVFDRNGRFVGNVGRAGAGPGEFRQIENVGWIGDTLWASDAALQRFTLFGSDSRPRSTIPRRVGDASGRAVGDFLTRYGRIVQMDPRVERSAPAPVIRMSRGGEIQDTISRIDYTNPMARIPNYSLIQPFPDHAIWSVDAAGRWLAIVRREVPRDHRRSSVTITLHDLQERTSHVFEMAYTPVPITQAMADTVLRRMPSGVPPSILRSALTFPAFLPPINAVLASSDGSVWVERRDGLSSSTWLRSDRRGVLTDSARVPLSYWVSDATARQLLAVIRPAEADGVKAPAIIFTIPR